MTTPAGDPKDLSDEQDDDQSDTGDGGRVVHDRMRQAIDLLFTGFDEAGARTGARKD